MQSVQYKRWITAGCSIGAMLLPVSLVYADGSTPAIPAPTISAFNVQFQGSESWLYDSNPLRLIDNTKSISGSSTSAIALLTDNTPDNQFSANTEVDRSFFDDSEFNSTDFHEKANLFTNTPLWRVGSAATFDYDTTRTSEISSFGISAPNVRHIGWSVSPEADFSATSIDKIIMAASLVQSNYESSLFTNYDFYIFDPSYTHNFDPLNTGTLTLNAERYRATTGTPNTIDTIGPSLGWVTIFTPQITGKVTGGVEYSTQKTTTITNSPSETNYVFSGNLTVKKQQDTIIFSASRNEQPFDNGNSSLLTTFGVNETHALNNTVSLTGSAAYSHAQYINETGINLNKQITGAAGIVYGLQQNLDLVANYQYVNQTLTNATGTIKDNVFTVGLSFHPFAKAL